MSEPKGRKPVKSLPAAAGTAMSTSDALRLHDPDFDGEVSEWLIVGAVRNLVAVECLPGCRTLLGAVYTFKARGGGDRKVFVESQVFDAPTGSFRRVRRKFEPGWHFPFDCRRHDRATLSYHDLDKTVQRALLRRGVVRFYLTASHFEPHEFPELAPVSGEAVEAALSQLDAETKLSRDDE